MSDVKNAVKTTALVLLTIYVLRRLPVTDQLVATALVG
ncbi:hypothetical protein OJJOAM_000238 [Cupriavidus sp. H18C1]